MVSQEERTGTWLAYGKPASEQDQPGSTPSSFSGMQKLALLRPANFARSSRFGEYLAIHFPEVVASMDETDFGVLHLEVAALMVATREAIARRDWPVVAGHFAFVDSVLETADTELHDAIGVSYLVALLYGETSLNYAKARTLLPKRLAHALEIMERHYEELGR